MQVQDMDNWLVSFTSIAAALGIGILMGTVRERHDHATMAGLRTHALVALLGVTAFGLGPVFFAAALLAVGALTVAGYLRHDGYDMGLTGEVALLLTLVLAGLAVRQAALAAALGVVAAVLLQAKAPLRQLSRHLITEQEIRDALLLLAAALVVMPLLPAHAVDPWGVLKPRTVWKIVVLVMAVGMLGHVALRLSGARWGLAVAGFFAGFASSTAATASFGQRAKSAPAAVALPASAAILANMASLLLLWAVVWASAPGLMRALLWPMLAALLALGLNAAFGLRLSADAAVPQAEPATARAFKLSHALLIAALIAGVTLLAAWLRSLFGDAVAVAAAMLAALTEVHPAAASMAQMYSAGSLTLAHAQWGVLGVLASSALAKSVLAFASGGVHYGARVALALTSMMAAAAAVLWLYPLPLGAGM